MKAATTSDAWISKIREQMSSPKKCEVVQLGSWSDEDWQRFFGATTLHRVPAGEVLIRKGASDRTLYLILSGNLEVTGKSSDDLSMPPLSRIRPGSVLGELSFFDGEPRSVSAWAVDDCDLAVMTMDQYVAFESSNPGLARDLLFALGRILATRLRKTTSQSWDSAYRSRLGVS
jgi:CRP-like cAMP-binding protein